MPDDYAVKILEIGGDLKREVGKLGPERIPNGRNFYFLRRPFRLLSDFGHQGTQFKIIISDKHIIQTFSI